MFIYDSNIGKIRDFDWYYKGVMRKTDVKNDPFLIEQIDEVVLQLLHKEGIEKLTPTNTRRILAVVSLIVCKFNLDIHHDNRYYATLVGITLEELNRIEQHILTVMCWELYAIYVKCLEKRSPTS